MPNVIDNGYFGYELRPFSYYFANIVTATQRLADFVASSKFFAIMKHDRLGFFKMDSVRRASTEESQDTAQIAQTDEHPHLTILEHQAPIRAPYRD